MTTYTWTIQSMDIAPSLNGLLDVVTGVYWMFTGVNENSISGSFPGYSAFPSPNATDYIPYNQLTYETICTWLETANDMPSLHYKVDIEIANILNPTYGTNQFPWS